MNTLFESQMDIMQPDLFKHYRAKTVRSVPLFPPIVNWIDGQIDIGQYYKTKHIEVRFENNQESIIYINTPINEYGAQRIRIWMGASTSISPIYTTQLNCSTYEADEKILKDKFIRGISGFPGTDIPLPLAEEIADYMLSEIERLRNLQQPLH